jgi:Uma2 family endonuclease
MKEAPRHHLVSFEEYLRIEEASVDVRHEYVGGVLYAMAGGTKRHNRMIGNMYRQLADAADAASCDIFTENVMLRVAPDAIYYPDLIVVCDPQDTDPLIASRPCLVVEVLSPGTASTDRREKLLAYRGVSTLQTYLVVYQDETRVDHHWRDNPQSGWQAAIVTDGSISVPCLNTELHLAGIYANLPPAAET